MGVLSYIRLSRQFWGDKPVVVTPEAVQPYIGNASWALFVLSILVWKRKLFLSKRGVNDQC